MTAIQAFETFLNGPESPFAVNDFGDPTPFEERIITQPIETDSDAAAVLVVALAWLQADHDDELHGERAREAIERVARRLGAEALPERVREYCCGI
jgi:hypothetical protein